MFSKPKDDNPTRHLIIANCGPGAGMPWPCTQALLYEQGAFEVSAADNNKPHVFASFTDEAAASRARENLTSEACAAKHRRHFVVKHAELKADPLLITRPVHLSTDSCIVPGLSLYQEFVTSEEEEDLLASVEQGTWESLAHRRVQHYGYKFEYHTRNVDKGKPIQPLPPCTRPILERLREVPDMPAVDQLTVNEYPPGVGLAPHIDTHSAFTGAIASLSLGGGCVMEMRRLDQAHAFYLPPRSLLVMAGAARYQWQHYIPHRKFDFVNGARLPRSSRRVSFTFRQARGFACTCEFQEQCDSQAGALPPTRLLQAEMRNSAAASPLPCTASAITQQASCTSERGGREALLSASQHEQKPAQHPHASDSCSSLSAKLAARLPRPADNSCKNGDQEADPAPGNGGAGLASAEAAAADLEARHVHAVYDVIASHFSATRFAVWPKVGAFLHALPPGSVLADVGCGNGKYFGVRPDLVVLASDRSFGLAEQAARCTRLPAASKATDGDRGCTNDSLADEAAGRAGCDTFLDGCGASAGKVHSEPALDAEGSSPRAQQRSRAGGVAAAPRADVLVADALQLPYRSGTCDAAICIAVLHHISSVARREVLLQEIFRVLRRGGQALITVWASEQEDPKKLAKWQPISREVQKAGAMGEGVADDGPGPATESSSGDYFVPWHLPFHRADAAVAVKRVGAAEDAEGYETGTVDKEKSSLVFKRFYHLFDQEELEGLVGQVSGGAVAASFYDKSNWCVILQKH